MSARARAHPFLLHGLGEITDRFLLL